MRDRALFMLKAPKIGYIIHYIKARFFFIEDLLAPVWFFLFGFDHFSGCLFPAI
jgi:hypothetical protein